MEAANRCLAAARWSLGSGQQLGNPFDLVGDYENVSWAFSPDGRLVAAAIVDVARVLVWDPGTRGLYRRSRSTRARDLRHHLDPEYHRGGPSWRW